MANIAANTYRLPIADKLIKGQEIITMSTGNPNIPGNAESVALLAAAQTMLNAANAAYVAVRQDAKQRLTARDNAEAAWNAAVNGLAAFTESATQSDQAKILSGGFGVRSARSAPQQVAPIEEVKVRFNGKPGYSIVTWRRDPQADAYRVQCSAEPITESSWKEMGTVIPATFDGNGATPGQRYWYRVAGVNRLGQGPWSQPALRPVM